MKRRNFLGGSLLSGGSLLGADWCGCALAPQTALVLGECVRVPALVRIREAQPIPRSRDPRFYKYWVSEQVADVDVEGVCGQWVGKAPIENSAPSDPPADINDSTDEV